MMSLSIFLLLCIPSATCQVMGSAIKPSFIIKNLTKIIMVEKIKHQILTHIGMSERPTTTPYQVTDLINSTVNTTARHVGVIESRQSNAEVNEIISFSEHPDKFQDEKIIQFRFAKDIKGKRLVVKSASLLIRVKQKKRKRQHNTLKSFYLNPKRSSRRKKARRGTRVSLSVSTVTSDGHPKENIAAVKSRIKKNKWFKVSLNRPLMQKLVDSSNGTVLLYVQCKGCKRNTQVVLVHSRRRKKRQLHRHVAKAPKSLKLNKGRPFLILHTFVETRERAKRNVGSQCWSRSNRCCKRQLYVDFTEIGWDDWIISPSGFTTAECFGSCQRRNSGISDIISECTPTRMRTLRLIYQDHTGVLVGTSLQNFIVAKCGCASRGQPQTMARERMSSK